MWLFFDDLILVTCSRNIPQSLLMKVSSDVLLDTNMPATIYLYVLLALKMFAAW